MQFGDPHINIISDCRIAQNTKLSNLFIYRSYRSSREPFELSILLLNTFRLVVGSFTAKSLIAICIKFSCFQLSFTASQLLIESEWVFITLNAS